MTQTHRFIQENLMSYLTDPELLASLIDVTVDRAQTILEALPIQHMGELNFHELRHSAGITQRQARILLSANHFARRSHPKPSLQAKLISCPEDVVQLLQPQHDTRTQEELHVLLINTRGKLISQHIIYRGNVNSTVVRPAELLRPAILAGVPSIIISHNHPGGDPTPSSADISMTKDIHAAAILMGITLLDHIVTAPDGHHISMKEAKMLDDQHHPHRYVNTPAH